MPLLKKTAMLDYNLRSNTVNWLYSILKIISFHRMASSCRSYFYCMLSHFPHISYIISSFCCFLFTIPQIIWFDLISNYSWAPNRISPHHCALCFFVLLLFLHSYITQCICLNCGLLFGTQPFIPPPLWDGLWIRGGFRQKGQTGLALLGELIR